ncbi:MAG: acyl-CoA dehydrogenase [Rhizomicrobium sp.]|jgi:alkylation response protein AidB-like acyl-CoA dehydrogenase
MTWRAPVKDISFALDEIVGVQRLAESGAFPGFDADTVAAVLEAGGALAEHEFAPLNRVGDETGAQYENGRVRAAPGFAKAYRAFADGGWNALAAPEAFGGQGLPRTLSLAVFEMMHSANMALGLCPMLTQGAIEALMEHGTDRQKQLYLPKLVSGEWTGTMNLTEPQAGSDLGAIKTRAEPDGHGGYRLNGQKIFITWGDHDMTDNIVHLVLARVPGAPDGSKGISMFLASSHLVNDDGSLGTANGVAAGRIEHKLGIHGSPTCTMIYTDALAELVGAPNNGLANMFTMMNAARLQVGIQGVAIAERAYQQALAFALERKQGRSAWTVEYPAPLFDHPDVRRMLMLMRARIEAGRAICLATAMAADLSVAAKDADQRESANLREEFFTPIAKAWCTDTGVEVGSLAVQVHGGMGYIEETGVAQHYRDARIAPIYEGTNGIQAIDLVGRKLSLDNGRAVQELLDDVSETVAHLNDRRDDAFSVIAATLAQARQSGEIATHWLREHRASPEALAGATAYLALMGDLCGGWLLAKGALAATDRLKQEPGNSWLPGRIAIAGFFSAHVLARSPFLLAGITSGARDLASISPGALGAA